jgi:hypothetical protein
MANDIFPSKKFNPLPSFARSMNTSMRGEKYVQVIIRPSLLEDNTQNSRLRRQSQYAQFGIPSSVILYASSIALYTV